MEKEVLRNQQKRTKSNSHAHQHPDYSVLKKRLAKIKGQLDGIDRMIDDRRYCPEIIHQIKAAGAALRAMEGEIFKTHLRGCVKTAFSLKDAFSAETKIEEIMKMFYRE